MKKTRLIAVGLVVLVSLLMVSAVSAQDPTDPETLTGTVTGVDPVTGDITFLPEGSTEPIIITQSDGEYDHPIVALLAEYFGGDGPEDWAAALEALDTDGGLVVSIEETTDTEGNTVYTATYEDGTTAVIEDEEEAAALQDALDTLNAEVKVTTDDEGNYVLFTSEDEIAAYHEMGIGFGELVKIYQIAAESQAACEAEAEAAGEGDTGDSGDTGDTGDTTDEPCGITVEELVQMVLDGAEMGDLFALYGKPSLLGVGHVRKANGGGVGGGEGDGDGSKGVCNARSHGGNANAKGQDITCP